MGRKAIHKQYQIGETYGDYDIVSVAESSKGSGRRLFLNCRICSRQKDIPESITSKKTGMMHSSCGKGLKTKNIKFYSHWTNMRTRTENKNYQHAKHYKDINSDDFEFFIDFYDDMYCSYLEHVTKYGEDNTTLDRIDSYKSYTKDNVRWTTWEIQFGNKKKNRWVYAISKEGIEYRFNNVLGFSREHDISEGSIRDYLNKRLKTAKGWHFEWI